jgi:hypothetical protein
MPATPSTAGVVDLDSAMTPSPARACERFDFVDERCSVD